MRRIGAPAALLVQSLLLLLLLASCPLPATAQEDLVIKDEYPVPLSREQWLCFNEDAETSATISPCRTSESEHSWSERVSAAGFETCSSFTRRASGKQFNFLISPPIDVSNDREVSLRLDYMQNNTLCADGVCVYSLLMTSITTSELDDALGSSIVPGGNRYNVTAGRRKFFKDLANPDNDNVDALTSRTLTLSRLLDTSSIRLIFIDRGTCSELSNVTVVRTRCLATKTLFNASLSETRLEESSPGTCLPGFASTTDVRAECTPSGFRQESGLCERMLATTTVVSSASTANPSSGGSSGSLGAGAIAGIVLVAVLVVLGIGAALMFGRGGNRGKTAPAYEFEMNKAGNVRMSGMYRVNLNLQYNQLSNGATSDTDMYEDPSVYQDFSQLTGLVTSKTRQVAGRNVTLISCVGSGEFGEVYHAAVVFDQEELDCAVKTLREGSARDDQLEFLQEAAIMCQFHHPNVIALLGVVLDQTPNMIITELMPNGSLLSYLQKHKDDIPLSRQLQMALDIALGMCYLSGKGFVHRDLAARNILVSKELTCKVADFGLSKEIDDSSDYFISEGGKVPIKWTAPEAIHQRKYTSSSDVWSFGVVVWEIMAFGEKPYGTMNNFEVVRKVEDGYRMDRPPKCPEAVHALMHMCWEAERRQRPTFVAVVDTLEEMTQDATNGVNIEMPGGRRYEQPGASVSAGDYDLPRRTHNAPPAEQQGATANSCQADYGQPQDSMVRQPQQQQGDKPTHQLPQDQMQQPTYQLSQDQVQQPTYQLPQDQVQQPTYQLPQDQVQQSTHQLPQDQMQQPTHQLSQDQVQQPTYQLPQDQMQQPTYQLPQDQMQQPTYQLPQDQMQPSSPMRPLAVPPTEAAPPRPKPKPKPKPKPRPRPRPRPSSKRSSAHPAHATDAETNI